MNPDSRKIGFFENIVRRVEADLFEYLEKLAEWKHEEGRDALGWRKFGFFEKNAWRLARQVERLAGWQSQRAWAKHKKHRPWANTSCERIGN